MAVLVSQPQADESPSLRWMAGCPLWTFSPWNQIFEKYLGRCGELSVWLSAQLENQNLHVVLWKVLALVAVSLVGNSPGDGRSQVKADWEGSGNLLPGFCFNCGLAANSPSPRNGWRISKSGSLNDGKCSATGLRTMSGPTRLHLKSEITHFSQFPRAQLFQAKISRLSRQESTVILRVFGNTVNVQRSQLFWLFSQLVFILKRQIVTFCAGAIRVMFAVTPLLYGTHSFLVQIHIHTTQK